MPPNSSSPDASRQALYRQEAITALNDGHIGASLFNFPRTLSVPACALFVGLLGLIAALCSTEFTHVIRVPGICCSDPTEHLSSGRIEGLLYIPERILPFVHLGTPVRVTLATGARVNGTILEPGTATTLRATPERERAADQYREIAVKWQLHEQAGKTAAAAEKRNQAIVASVTMRAGVLQWAISLLADNRKKT